MAFGNLTVDFRQLARVPVRDRVALAQSSQASEIFGNLTPSQIAALFPDYYKKFIPQATGGGSMAAGLTGAGTTTGTGTSTSTATSTTATAPTTRPGYPGFIEEIIGGTTPAPTAPPRPGKYRPVYSGAEQDARNRDLLNIIGNEARSSNESIDAVINNMMNRLGSPSYGNPRSLAEVAKQPNQYESWTFLQSGRFKPVSDERAEKIAERLKLISQGGLPDTTKGANEFRAESYVFGKGRGKDFYRDAEKQGFVNLGGNIYARRGNFQYGPYAAYEVTGETPPEVTEPSATLPGTAPITGQTPQGSDAQIQNLLGTPADQSTAVVAAPRGPAKTMILSLGTNDFSDPSKTYQNTIDAINEGRKKGYNVVVVPPVGNNDRFKAAYDEVMRAVNETGASVEQPQSYSSDGYHPTAGEYKRIGEKYQGAVVVGDSIAVGIGQYTQNGQTVATEGIRTDAILAKLRSDQIIQLDTAQVSPQTTAFDPSVFAQLDPRLKKWHDEASPQDRLLLETAIKQKGVGSINEIMARYPEQSATAATSSVLSGFEQRVSMNEDVMMGNAPFIQGNDFAVPIYTNAKGGKRFDENLEGLTPQAIERLKQQAVAAKAAGLTKLELYGAQTHVGHASHGAGTETDLVGYNPDGSAWTRDQRAITALGAVQLGGANRVGLYGGQGLHVGMADEVMGGPKIESAWGPNGKTSNVAIEEFTPGLERELAAYLKGVGPKPQSKALDEHLQRMQEAQQQTAQVQAIPGTQPQTQPVRPDDTAQIPLQQSTANTAPAMKLGGEMDFKEPNSVKESMSLMSNGKEVAQFNKNENVSVEDGKIKVQNEYAKGTEEAQRRNHKGAPPANQYSMRQTAAPETPRTFPDQVKYGIVPQSPSARRQFETAQFGGYDHFSRRSHSA